MIGKKFGRLKVISAADTPISGNKRYLCKCECGKETIVCYGNLKNGHTKSCGCLQKENMRTHGSSYTREYKTWLNIKSRCTNLNSTGYEHYGGKGVKIQERWLHNFKNFLEDVGRCPKGCNSIDRINNNGNYESGNVRWSTSKIQANNTSRNHNIEFCGVIKSVQQWSEFLKIKPNTIIYRLRRGWSIDEAFEFKQRSKKYKGILSIKQIEWLVSIIDSGGTQQYCSKILKIDDSQISRVYNRYKEDMEYFYDSF